MRFEVAHEGFVIVALEDCLVVINAQKDTLKAGDHKEFRSGDILEISPAHPMSPRFVVVDVLRTSQPLTIAAEDLATGQKLEDASEKNETLLIALDTFQIRDERDLADEGEPWKPSHARFLHLHRGEAAWLKHGMHRLRNTGNTAARFISIEW